ncbi:uncharacterized protein CANTADRAFT_51731 [Suhomyces tanzawaensis NRRL Y-17324]|uniref:RING-CH-type domain-containing protein n=1 Tax=Suhomyces tanzawaensis NRRL Y-17324 TaxID=984487 RepID=A0A1E4SIM8_9ASCO|nr:uncharacterized protein CANTADRAFT_51731 [Suhomyces tanzawaensis NRRL Y-17324]ODV79363.1 hypothetical protein CANTADRAFT_51731 [Suhomyces tanzawaensis NRRL Y-17324]
MASPKVCCFCLGGETDVPSFGELKDGEDFICPCSTCSIQSHRKCLLDWFNALPLDKLQVIDPQAVHETLTSRRNALSTNLADNQDNTTQIYIDLSPGLVRDWISQNLWSSSDNATGDVEAVLVDFSGSRALNTPVVFILAPCPQCKLDIVFSMKRSSLLAANTNTRQLLIRTIQFGGLFLGFTSAVTGVVSMGYIGLTSCGLKMMDCLIPGPLLVLMLTKRNVASSASSTYNTLSQLLLGNVNNYAIDNLEQALYKGLIDPLKFSRIPLLPIMLYRMRGSSLSECLFGKSKELKVSNWVTEFLVNGYISSLGNHELARIVLANGQRIVTDFTRDPTSVLQGVDLFRGVNWWKTPNMISMVIPIRWAYDLFSRLVINKAHFDLTLSIRPREITNSLPPGDVEVLEELNDKLKELERRIQHERIEVRKHLKISPGSHSLYLHLKKRVLLLQTILTSNIPFSYVRLTLANWWYKLKACLVNDYSQTLLTQSTMIRCVTTLIWPYLSSKLGTVVFHTVLGRMVPVPNVPHEKLVLLSNIIGLVGVVFVKDLANLYLSYKRANQLSNMRILTSYSPPEKKDTSKPEPGHLDRINSNVTAAYNRFFAPATSTENYPTTEESGDEEYQDTQSFPGSYPW